MRIVGLDLSSGLCGYSSTTCTGELLEIGWQNLSGSVGAKLQEVYELVTDLVERDGQPVILSTERPRGWSADVLFVLGRINGIVHLVGERQPRVVEVAEYGPQQLKIVLAGKGNANKEDQIEAFLALYPNWRDYQKCDPYRKKIGRTKEYEELLTSDEADAYGSALCVVRGRIATYVRTTGGKGVVDLEKLGSSVEY